MWPTTLAGARMKSSASPGRRLTGPVASSGSRRPARRRWLGRMLPISHAHRRGPGAVAGAPRPRQLARLPPRWDHDPPLAHGMAHRLPGGRRADPLPPRLSAYRRPQPDPRERPRAGRHAPDRAQEPCHLRPLQHHPRAGTARRRRPAGRLSGTAGAGGAGPSAAPHGQSSPPRAPHHPSASYDAAPRKSAPLRVGGVAGAGPPPGCAPGIASRPTVRASQRSRHTWRRGGPTRPTPGTHLA